MMKNCGRCERPVYPTEELKCLDKVWHRTCFKCQSCNMTLNMKTYKGYDKLPYCEAHIPKAKATTVSETPELRRIAENTKLQSQVRYHEDFEKAKGKFTQVADDPETLRIKANTKIISNVAYHGDLEKKAIMEQKRSLTGGDDPVTSESPEPKHSSPEYQPPLPPSAYQHIQPQKLHIDPNANQYTPAKTVASQQKFSVGSVPSTQNDSPYSARQHMSSTVVYSSQPKEVAPMTKSVGSISDYDPLNDNFGSLTKSYRGTSTQQQQQQQLQQQQQQLQQQQQQQQQQQNSYGASQPTRTQGYPAQAPAAQPQSYNNSNSVSGYRQSTNYAPPSAQPTPQYQQAPQPTPQYQQQQQYQQSQFKEVTSNYQQSHTQVYQQSQAQPYQQPNYNQQQAYQPQVPYQQQQQPQYQPYTPAQAPPQRKPQGQAVRAMYDYDAQDADEVSFLDGDVIVNCTPIDEGWMTGTIKRTGQTGMIPANYVEPIH